MSLIDEALRRARQEAARQDAAKRDAQYRQVPVYAPPRRQGISPALIGALVALCIVAGIGIGVFLGRDRGAEPEAVETTPPPAEAPASPSEPPTSQPVSVAEEETPEPEPLEAAATPAPTPAPIPAQEVPAAGQEPLEPPPAPDPEPTPAPVAVPETPPAPAPTPEPAPTPAPEIRTYVREVPLPDGGTLRLNGIAFSAAQPVALIDDKVLAKGESYEGFVVTDIQANLVELRGNGMTVRVSLK